MTKVEEQILQNQIVIMGMLQDVTGDPQYGSPNIVGTHDLIVEDRKGVEGKND